MKKVLFSLCLFLASCAAGHESVLTQSLPNNGIFGGENAFKSQYGPYAAILYIVTDSGGFTCTATPILPDFMLASAHCLVKGFKQLKVLFFADQVSPSILRSWPASKTRVVKHYEIPAQYQNKMFAGRGNPYDIALLQLDAPMPDGMKTFTLSTRPPNLAVAHEVGLLGYGYEDVVLEPNGQKTPMGSELFRYASQSLLPNPQAGMILLDGHRGQGTCAGDSGGPVFLQHGDGDLLLVGLTSARLTFNNQADQCRVNSLAVEISRHVDWISHNTQRLFRQAFQ